MKFTILSIFPEMITSFLNHGIIRRAVERNLISAVCTDIRDFAEGKHRVTDDRPYGGGCGMVMKPEPLCSAIRHAQEKMSGAKTILLSPQGRPFNQNLARQLVDESGLILVCGRYEGVDERVCHKLIDDEISIGDFVLSGGEPAAMVIIDAITRLVPGALGGEDSADMDSFENGLLEHAHFTRPRVYEGDEVPEVLLSGNHSQIEDWRHESSLMRTLLKRPDLLEVKPLSSKEIEILKKWGRQIEKITCV